MKKCIYIYRYFIVNLGSWTSCNVDAYMDVLQYNYVQVCMHSVHPLFPLSTARCSATHFDFLGCSSPWIAAFNVYSGKLDVMRNNEKHLSRND